MLKLTRREFIKAGLTTALMLYLNPFKIIASSRSKNWKMPEAGRLSYLSGNVYINGKIAEVGDNIVKGDTVKTGSDSEADIEIRDFAVFHIKQNTEITIDQILNKTKLTVKRGWFLTIVKRGTPFIVATPMILAGVRGTVFFFNVINENSLYFCDCNGTVDLIQADTGERIKRVVSYYHTAYTINKSNSSNIEYSKSTLKYHDDNDILRIANRFPVETRVFRQKQNGKKKKGNSGYN